MTSKGLLMRRERSLLAFLIFNEEFYSQLPLMTCLEFAWGSLTFLKGRSLMRKLLKKRPKENGQIQQNKCFSLCKEFPELHDENQEEKTNFDFY